MTTIDPQFDAPGRQAAVRRGTVATARTAVTILFLGVAAINLGAFVTASSLFPATHLVAALLAVYLLVECRFYLRRTDAFGLLSPAFLAPLVHFLLAYLGVISLAAFWPRVIEGYGYWLPDLDGALAETMLMAMLAAFCMLRGYGMGQPMARRLRRALKGASWLRKDLRPDMRLAVTMQLAYLGLVVLAIDLQVYGLLSTPATIEQHAGIVQFLNLFLAAGTLSYFLILLRYFERRATGRATLVFTTLIIVLVALHVIAGALAAFKSQIVFPFVLGGFAYFITTGRVPRGFMAAALAALVIAYAVIEPFRSYIKLQGKPPASLVEAVEGIATAYEMRDLFSHDSDITQVEAIIGRFDMSGMTALAVDFVARGDLRAADRQKFQDSILLAPILAYVPRALWQDKPIYTDNGVWFNQTVRGRWHDERTAVGMGPIGYVFMAGGIVAIVLVFTGFGVLQALLFEGVARSGAGGLIVFLSVATVLITIPTSLGPVITGMLRMLPFAILAQMILLRKSGRSSRSDLRS